MTQDHAVSQSQLTNARACFFLEDTVERVALVTQRYGLGLLGLSRSLSRWVDDYPG